MRKSPKSPRSLRNHSIIVKNWLGEDADFNSLWQETKVGLVKVERSYGIMQSRKGVISDDKSLIVMDLQDYQATPYRSYILPILFKQLDSKESHFTFDTDKDIIRFSDGTEEKINTIKLVDPFGSVAFVEITTK